MQHLTREDGHRIGSTPSDLLKAARRYADYHSRGRYLDGKVIRYPGVYLWTTAEIAAIFWAQVSLRPAQSVPETSVGLNAAATLLRVTCKPLRWREVIGVCVSTSVAGALL